MAFTRIAHAVRLVSRSVLDVLASRRCGACGQGGVARLFCAACAAEVAPEPARLRVCPASLSAVPVLAIGPFAPPLSLAIKQLKYSGRTDLAAPLAEFWWERWRSTVAEAGRSRPSVVLLPVPLHPQRLIERGFNQSGLLATRLARLARVHVRHDVLERIHATAQQARLSAAERAQNLNGAFCISRARGIAAGAQLVLVDDVVTTGATLAACQAACQAHGLSISAVWTLAHTERERRPR